jgi:O-acetyl-ADP-ribose deacetylase (regulator of RNase III)
MKIIFFDRNEHMINAWKNRFANVANIEYFLGDFKDIKTGNKKIAIISPANSFGVMNGGIDLAYSEHFGWNLQEEVQNRIKNEYYGELLVGQSFTVETYNDDIPYMIIAPTMRLPMPSHETPNAYLAMKAILREAIKNNVEYVLICGLCTGAGHMTSERSANQMWKAYDEVINGNVIEIKSIKDGSIHYMPMLFN